MCKHVCGWCQNSGIVVPDMKYGPVSSSDVILSFTTGRIWQFPYKGLPHYITVHQFLPPQEFIDDVMEGKLLKFFLSLSSAKPVKIGYLVYPEDFAKGEVPTHFIERLEHFVIRARSHGSVGDF